MRERSGSILFLLALASCACSSTAAFADAGGRADPLLFACATPQGRLLVRDAGSGRVTIAFPKAGTPALARLARQPQPGRYARTGYSGGGMEQLQIDTGSGRLTIYSRTVRTNFGAGEPNDPAFSSGAIFQARNRRAIRRDCRDAEGFRGDIGRGRPVTRTVEIPDR